MPVYRIEESTNRFAGRDEFLLLCDCSGANSRCVQLGFSVWEPDENDEEQGVELCVTLLPEQYPARGWTRIKAALQMLCFGRLRYNDDMVLYR